MNKISYAFVLLRSLIPSLIFNLRFLPFKQAIKLPILIYKPHFRGLSGKFIIDSDNIHYGMIRLGFFTTITYPNSGIMMRNNGTVIFKGKCRIGNACHISCGKHGKIAFGEDFRASGGIKIMSECGITFGKHTSFGWGVIAIDTNFHPLYDMEKEKFKRAWGKIEIGDNNWFAMNCLIMPGVITPKRCIFGARTIVTRGGNYESYCVHGGSPIRVLSRNVKRIIGQDFVKDYPAS